MEPKVEESEIIDRMNYAKKILKEYANDLRAHYARHAGAVLRQKH